MVRVTLLAICSLLLLPAHGYAAAQQVTLLDFSLPTCAPCRQMDPVVARLEADGFAVKRVDGSRSPQVAQRFGVDRYPTFIVMSGGQVLSRTTGVTSYDSLRQQLVRAGSQPGAARSTFGSARQDSRVELASNIAPIAMKGPPPIDIPGKAAAPRAAAGPAITPIPATGVEANAAPLLNASVRLKVEDATGHSFGTGTVVDARDGEALVLTCAHLFRDDKGEKIDDPSAVTVELYQSGAKGLWVAERVPVFRILSCNFESDVAFVTLRPRGQVRPARIASANTLRQGDPVLSVGCDQGADPSVRTSQVTAINRYQGPPNVTSTGAPVVGRSGGGLFSPQGEVVGVCNAADYQDDEGIYAALPAIHAELDKLKLTAIYRHGAAAQQETPAEELAPMTPLVRAQDAGPLDSVTTLSGSEKAALQEIARRATDSEVVCVIRPKTPGGQSQVLTLDHVSPEFVKALLTLAQQQENQPPAWPDSPR